MAFEQNRRRRSSALVLLAFLLNPQAHSSDNSFQVAGSCKSGEEISKWPAIGNGVVCTFVRDKDDLQTLHSLMSEVGYSNVVRLGEERVIGYNSPGDGEIVPEALANSARWLDLMNKTQTQVLKRSGNASIFSTVSVESSSDRVDTYYYHTGDLPEAKKCEEQFQDVPCGICDLARIDDWTIRYVWSSGPHIGEYFQPRSESAGEDEQVERDRFDKFHKTNFECLRRGLEEMEFENATDFF